jgi:hypothetical protein
MFQNLSQLRILDREQIAKLASFGSVSRVNARLARLRQAGLLIRYFTSTTTGSRRSLYALSKAGAVAAGVPFQPTRWKPESTLLGNAFVAHQLALNYLYIEATLDRDVTWQTFPEPLSSSVPLVPDACIQTTSQSMFIEMDLGTEALGVWARKTALYLKLASSGAYRSFTPHPQFAVLVVTDDEKRMHSLRRQVSKQTQKLFWFATTGIIKRQGFWTSLWLRSTGEAASLPGG